uniref:Chromo domain-containing protein LHP1-like isoform X1 n=1 Tax=Rhizophora mucronata TaxID=61149 RepID=A0A2P2M5X0_RHIMU
MGLLMVIMERTKKTKGKKRKKMGKRMEKQREMEREKKKKKGLILMRVSSKWRLFVENGSARVSSNISSNGEDGQRQLTLGSL